MSSCRPRIDEGMHFQVIIIAETVRGPRFGPTPSRSRGRRLSAVIVQPIDAAQPELSLPLEELPCFYLIFYNRELARASRKLVIRPIRLLHVIIFILLFSIVDISFVIFNSFVISKCICHFIIKVLYNKVSYDDSSIYKQKTTHGKFRLFS